MEKVTNGKGRKIPYDNEPIYRNATERRTRRTSAASEEKPHSKLLFLLLCVLIIFNVIFASVAISKGGGSNIVTNPTYNIYPEKLDVQAVVEKAEKSVVLVHSGLPSGTSSDTISTEVFSNMRWKGSGVIIDDVKQSGYAYILTCYHVVQYSPDQVYIMLYDSFEPIKAVRVSRTAYTTTYDLAIYKIENSDVYKKSAAAPCTVADSGSVVVGQGVVAIGNPQGRGFSTTDGIVSVASELITVQNSAYQHRVMRISSPINAGNSGGGLFDSTGNLLGIVSVKAEDSATSSVDCIAYAIPSTLAVNVAYNMIRNSILSLAYTGLSFAVESGSLTQFEEVDGRRLPYSSIVISAITEDSPFSGHVRVGQKVVGFMFNGQLVKFRNVYSLEDYAPAIKVGDQLTLVLEGDQKVMVNITKTTQVS